MSQFEVIYKQLRDLASDHKVPKQARVTSEFWWDLQASDNVETHYTTDSLRGDRTLFGLPVVVDERVTDPRGFEIEYR